MEAKSPDFYNEIRGRWSTMQSKSRDPFDQMVGQRIKRQRKHLGLTQEELVLESGKNNQRWSVQMVVPGGQ